MAVAAVIERAAVLGILSAEICVHFPGEFGAAVGLSIRVDSRPFAVGSPIRVHSRFGFAFAGQFFRSI